MPVTTRRVQPRRLFLSWRLMEFLICARSGRSDHGEADKERAGEMEVVVGELRRHGRACPGHPTWGRNAFLSHHHIGVRSTPSFGRLCPVTTSECAPSPAILKSALLAQVMIHTAVPLSRVTGIANSNMSAELEIYGLGAPMNAPLTPLPRPPTITRRCFRSAPTRRPIASSISAA